LELINDILELSKIEAGRSAVVKNSFDFHQFLNTLEDVLRVRSDKKGLKLLFEKDDELPTYIRTDERKLRQILFNILTNSVKFTDEGGVVLRVRAKEKNQKYRIEFEVEDSGVGIPDDEIDGIFEAFTQSTSGENLQEGTGLGLGISQQFVKLLDGEITVRSEVGKGTIFSFYIIAEMADKSELKEEIEERRVVGLEANQSEYKILIVDDKVESRILLRKMLERVGFWVKEAGNGEEAIEIYKDWRPDLIWMDIRMPVMNGYEATRRIKSIAGDKPPIIIALTASAFEEQKSVILAIGCDDFVRKPFRESEIFNKMEKFLGVQYVCKEAESEESEFFEMEEEINPEELAELPDHWIAKLREAATKGKSKEILDLTEQIKPERKELVEKLEIWVSQFRFDKIVGLMKQGDVNDESIS
jgi:CheY-like chemotaxis protein/anti-sigma regulatory factor (Ser/Thr protein kinase)